MILPFFGTKENKDALKEFYSKWSGTPFHARAKVCQGGVDCVQLVVAMSEEMGIKHESPKFRYSLDWGNHNKENQLLNFLKRLQGFEEVDPEEWDDLMPGDLLLFKTGNVTNHLGVLVSETKAESGAKRLMFMHVDKLNSKVMLNDLQDSTWNKLLGHVVRIYQ